MRSWLRWLLLTTILSTGAALFWPDGSLPPVANNQGTLDAELVRSPRPEGRAADPDPPAVLPIRLAAVSLDRAEFDPFVGVQPPPPPPPPATPAQLAQSPVLPPPSAPPLDYRYLGRIVDPAGRQIVYLGKPDDAAGSAIAVAVGAQLEEGYQIESIDANRIGLVYPPLDTHVVIDIPPPPEFTPP